MNTGKTLFAQIKDLLPWKTFHRIVARHGGDKGVRTLTCAEKFRTMAFAQLTNRQSLRDFEACMQAQAPKKPSSPRIHRRKAAIDIPIPESGQSPQAGECPLPSLHKCGSGHSQLATGADKLSFNFQFRFFILAGNKAVWIPAVRQFRKTA